MTPGELDDALAYYQEAVRDHERSERSHYPSPLDQAQDTAFLKGVRWGALQILSKLGYGEEALEVQRQVLEDGGRGSSPRRGSHWRI